MGKRDPELTLRNKEITALTEQIDALAPDVLKLTGHKNIHSLNATYGSKHAEYIDIKNEVIDTPEQFSSLYLQGFLRTLEGLGKFARPGNAYYDAYAHIRDHKKVQKWLVLFLKRTFLRKYLELSKVRPSVEESIIWIGQKNASYGLLVTPRFKNGQWENDKSEIRKFKPRYWTVGHIVATGLMIPGEEQSITFKDIEQYLAFFQNTLVRNSGSVHELNLAKKYCAYVRSAAEPEHVPLLIPEWRYGGTESRHEYRLDFVVINPFNMSKVGFELSPWSTHGELTGVKGKTQKAINEEAKASFEKEMKKLKSYFRKFGITVLVYTDTDLQHMDDIFAEVEKYLAPSAAPKQLQFQAMKDFLNFDTSLYA